MDYVLEKLEGSGWIQVGFFNGLKGIVDIKKSMESLDKGPGTYRILCLMLAPTNFVYNNGEISDVKNSY